MKILSFGSVNIDYVYQVPHFVQAGETLASDQLQTFLGGKGCNQSVALAKAGANVFHAGNINEQDEWIIKQLKEWQVDTQFIRPISTSSGHAIIQISPAGENAIVIHGGANHAVDAAQIEAVFEHFDSGDVLLLQNEINLSTDLMRKAKSKGMTLFFNPAPMAQVVLDYPLHLVDYFILNETEAQQLTQKDTQEEIEQQLLKEFPGSHFLLTLGAKGALFFDEKGKYRTDAHEVKVIDTTAAGDTFIGYFIAAWSEGKSIEHCLAQASIAAAITVTRAGGAISIPTFEEVGSRLIKR